MQEWVVAIVWSAALVFGAIVLGFTSYEVVWKARRLSADQARLVGLTRELALIARSPSISPAASPGSED